MLVSLGLDHRSARLDLRERFHLEHADLPRLHAALAASGASESVLTRTCNRVEIYTWWPGRESRSELHRSIHSIARAWAGDDNDAFDLLLSRAAARQGEDAARHLFRVASGLESQIVGDIHILGQIRRALREAVEADSIGTHLQRLFETALRVGKRVQRGTRLSEMGRSVGSEAARAAADLWGAPGERACLVVGCGKSGAQAARTLRRLGASNLTLLNRTLAKAEKLARELGAAQAGGLDRLGAELSRAEIVIVATGAPEPILTRDVVERALSTDRGPGPLRLIDVSVPRSVSPDVREISGVELVDLDTLRTGASDSELIRSEAIREAEALVDDMLEEFAQWTALNPARRALVPFHEVLSRICQRELSHVVGGDAEAVVDRTATRIVASVMAHPMMVARAASERGEPIPQALNALELLFSQPRDGIDALRHVGRPTARESADASVRGTQSLLFPPGVVSTGSHSKG